MPPPTASTPAGRQIGALAWFLLVSYAAAAVGTVTQGGDVGGTYLALDPPAWAPPPWLFGPVWTVLYALIGVAGWWVWWVGATDRRGPALGLWTAQLVVNAAWPGVFFGLGALGWALVAIVTLDVLVVATIVAVAKLTHVAAVLLVPYLAWILFATALNAALWLGG